MKIAKLVFLLLFYLGFNSQASGSLNIEEVTTRKGFRFLFVKNCDLPKVSLSISFKDAGYAYESAEKQGLTWFTSLVIQEGAGKNNSKNFARKLEDKGISISFNADLEAFRVSLNTLSENLEDAISLLSDAIIRPRVDSEGLSRVLEKAKVNLNNLEKNPYLVALKELYRLLFKNHPYSKSEYGTFNTVMNITRDDVLTYMKHNFTKGNVVISVVGCTTKEEVSILLDKYLSKLLPKRLKVIKIPVRNDFGFSESKSVFMDIPQSIVLFAQKGIAYDDPNYYSASVLINALGGIGLNSVMMKELRQNLSITYSVSTSIILNKHGSAIAGFMSTDGSTAGKAISVVKDIFSKIKKEGIEEQLFKATKASMINSYVFSMSNNDNIAARLDDIQINDLDIHHINDYASIINNVKLEEVNALAGFLLDPENLFFVEVGRNTQNR